MQYAVEEGIEYELRVLLVITYLTTKRQVVLALCQSEIDGVQAHIVIGQRVNIAIAIDTRFRRGSHIKEQLREIDTLTLQNRHQRVVALALHMNLHNRQQATQGRLVDDFVGELGTGAITQNGELFEQLFVVAAAIQLHNEVATLCPDDSGIGGGIQVQSYKL